MFEKDKEELEKCIFPHAISRLRNTVLVDIVKVIIAINKFSGIKIPEEFKKKGQKVDYYFTILIRCFINLLINCSNKMHITQIASIIIAEANYELNVSSWSGFVGYSQASHHVDAKFILESEVHDWLIFLDDHKKLPGKYKRSLGFYQGNVM